MRMPNNFEDVMNAVKKDKDNTMRLDGIRPIAKKIVKAWDNKPEREKEIVSKIFKDLAKLIEGLRNI